MSIASINPATGETLKEFRALDSQQIEAKLAKAVHAFEQHRRTSFTQRAQWLAAAADLLEQQKEELALLRRHVSAEVTAAEAEAAQVAVETAQVADAIAAAPLPREITGNGGIVKSGPVAVDQLATWMLAQAGFPGGAA